MNGRKRFCPSDSNLETNNDSPFGSKRIMEASPFDVHKAEPSRVSEQPPFDAQRAESSRQHVRALNTQFASWVQSQLQNHPDELWEDGVQDYLTHASHILDKFSDVVDWLKANAAKAKAKPEIIPAFGPHTTQNKSIFGIKNNEVKFQFPDKSGIAQVGTTSNFSSPWSSSTTFKSQTPVLFGNQTSAPTTRDASDDPNGVAQVGSTSSFPSPWSSSITYKSQTPVLFGSQNSAPITRDTSDDPNGEDELEQPSSPSVKKSEEKGIVVVHEVKCKLYVKSTDPADKDAWKDKGMGQLSIKCNEGISKATKESRPTVVVRNEVGKVLLNALIYPGIKTNLMKNAIAAIFHSSGDASGNDGGGTNDNVVARTYLIRTKTEEERNKLASAIQDYAPAA